MIRQSKKHRIIRSNYGDYEYDDVGHLNGDFLDGIRSTLGISNVFRSTDKGKEGLCFNI